jgi:LPS export ABC transporter protein LptC
MSPRRIAKALAAFGAVAVATLVLVTIYVVRTRKPEAILTKAVGLIPGSFLHVHNFHWTQLKEGKQEWVLTANDASYSGDKTLLFLTRPLLTTVSDEGKPVTVEAPKAVITMSSDNHPKKVVLTGGTVIHYGDFVVNMDEATMLPDTDQVDSPGLVTINGEGLQISGVGMTGHPRGHQFELLSRVSTVIQPRGGNAKKSKG